MFLYALTAQNYWSINRPPIPESEIPLWDCWFISLVIYTQRVAEKEESRATKAQRGRETAENRQREMVQRSVERLAETEERLQEPQWVVERREIQLTDQELGRGAWATVSVAMFRGIPVAAKRLHSWIVSPHNIQLFQREINMAARIRHPNLLLFIGATLEGEMVILTELMPTSLRRELQRESKMSPRLTISIGLDVANNPTQQSPKMDIFSFGALLMEMLTGECNEICLEITSLLCYLPVWRF